MPKSLADGHTKFTILLEEPVDPANPTVAELNGGIDASCAVLDSDFLWTAADSDKVAEKELCVPNNANAISASNYQAGMTPFRKFNAGTGAVDPTEDAVFQAVMAKGTTFWGYVRRNGKLATAAWAAGDEIPLGLEVLTDTPQYLAGGFIKYRVPLEPQKGWDFIEAAA